MSERGKTCHICGVRTKRPVPIWYQAAIAPGSKPKEAFACPSCADLLSDEDSADYYDEDEMGER